MFLKTMRQMIIQVDAFTHMPFKGNPAAVCILSEPREESWMQEVAREMSLSETAFVHREADGFRLRWFTPELEVDLCGHATLAAAHVLWEEKHVGSDAPVRFYTRSGLLTAERKSDWIELNFPIEPEEPSIAPPELIEALGITPMYVGRNRFDYLIEVESEKTVRNLKPNFLLLATLPVRGVIVTSSSSSPEYDFVSRFFAPRSGIPEDPVTGSAHCCLGPFWGNRLNKTEMVAYQASSRGGVVRVRLDGERAFLSGQAVTVLRGELV
jgi:PhzF family phenazine biosynthesis protein